MKSLWGSKIICIVIIFALLAQALLPTHAIAISATVGNKTLDYSNPNKDNKSPYKLSFKNVVNGDLLTSLVGCTGIVNKVSKVSTEFLQDLLLTKAQRAVRKIEKKAAETTKKTVTGVGAVGESVEASTPTGTSTGLSGNPVKSVTDAAVNALDLLVGGVGESEQAANFDRISSKLSQANFREDCLNGIATTLARNQLTAMTKATMNWITTGFGGDPMYVRNVDSFMDNITQKILQRETDLFKDPQSIVDQPYGRDFARGEIMAAKAKSNVDDALKQDLTGYLKPGSTVGSFSNDFSQGGWGGWLALTQHPQNNPLGYNVLKAQDVADKQTKEVENQKAELVENGGYLSQKVCKVFGLTNKSAAKKIDELKAILAAANTKADAAKLAADNAAADAKRAHDAVKTAADKAAASAAADRADANAQLLLAKVDASIADVNAANSAVISANTSANAAKDPNADCIKWETVTPGSTIKDKVSTYINSPERQLELAKTINDSLNALFTALINKFQNQGLSSLGSGNNTDFSTVSGGLGSNSIATMLSTGFDKNGDLSDSTDNGQPIDITKDLDAIIQLQRDYIAAVNKYLKITLGVLPAIGKLDYCIPGPNPSWKANADEITVYINNAQESRISKIKPSTYSNRWRSRKKNRARRAAEDAEAKQAVLDQLEKEEKVLKARAADYEAKITVLYGPKSPMQTETLDNINPNPSYLPMAQVGLNITKNLTITADNIAEDNQTLSAAVADTNGYIYQLNKIKKKVDAIVATAQKRNDADRKANGLPAINAQCRLAPATVPSVLQPNLEAIEAEQDRQDKIRTGLNPDITDKMRNDLEAFGYTSEQIDAMTAPEALGLLDKIYAQH